MFPVGSELADSIERCLNSEFGGDSPTHDGPICQTLKQVPHSLGDPEILAANRIRRGISAQDSIDDFLNEWTDDPAMSRVAKTAIAFCIAKAERESNIFGIGNPGE